MIFYEREKIDTLKELVDRSALKFGNKEAIKFKEKKEVRSKTYVDLKKDTENFGKALNDWGLIGKHIGVLGDSSYQWIVTYLGTVNSGSVIVPIDKELPSKEITALLKAGDVRCLVYDDTYSDLAKSSKKPLAEITHEIKFSELLEKIKKTNDFKKNIDPDKMTAILFTSGTTGKSKGVMLSHRNLAHNVICGCSAVDLGSEDRILSVLPITHTYEFTCGILCMIYFGTTICINDSLKYISKNLKLFKASIVCVVPVLVETLYKKILIDVEKQGKTKKLNTAINLSNFLLKFGIDLRKKLFSEIIAGFGGELKILLCGGAPLKTELIQGYKNFGIKLIQGYGITECSPLVAVNSDRWLKKESVGKVVPYCEVKIIKDELYVKGSIVMLGYYKEEALTKEAFEGEWFKTGDLGYVDQDKFIYITGRKKNLIILSNGENISPEALEVYFSEISLIKEIIIFSEDNLIMAEIFPNPENFSNTIEEEIRLKVEEFNKNLPICKQIQKIRFRRKEFEKTNTRKIKRHRIGENKNV